MSLQTAQIFVALVSLTYSVNGGTNYNDTYTAPGPVRASNLSAYHALWNPTLNLNDPEIMMSIANNYGHASEASPCCPYDDHSDILNSQQDCSMYCKTGSSPKEYAYRFKEYNVNDTSHAYPLFTNRVITSTSAPCRKYNQTANPHSGGYFTYSYRNATYNSTIVVPHEYITVSSTQYIYRDNLTAPQAQQYACGPRCITLWAHVTENEANNDGGVFYECDVSFSEVSNVTNATTQAVSNDVARLAAASIALSGRTSDGSPGTVKGPWQQYSLYIFG